MKKLFLSLIALACCFASCFADDCIKKETFVYSVKGNDTLKLDKYDCPVLAKTPKTCVIFVFGGGFFTGSRENADNVEYMRKLAEKGYTAIAIDYRLGMKDAAKVANSSALMLQKLGESVTMAVTDLYDATAFVCKNADNWHIDKSKIIANGSSAGAITVLQAEYLLSNRHPLSKLLPEGFNYAGIISFAGAVLSEGGLHWGDNTAPLMLFHGDADSNVPFDKLTIGNFGLYGSNSIAAALDGSKSPYYFYKEINAAHELAVKPMTECLNEISTFIEKIAVGGQKLQYTTTVNPIGKPTAKKNFTIEDFIRTNYR